MSITTEIQRLHTNINNMRQNVSDTLDAIRDKGVDVPSGAKLADCPELISLISGGGGGGGGDLPDTYIRLPSITNGTANYSQIQLGALNFPLNVETNDKVIFSFTCSNNYSSSAPELTLIDSNPQRYLGLLIDWNYTYASNYPIYSSWAGELQQLKSGGSYVIEQSANIIIINGTKYTITNNSGNESQTITTIMTMLGNTPQQTYIHEICVKSSSDIIKYDLVPVLNTSTNKKGLFDIISQTFLELSNYQN